MSIEISTRGVGIEIKSIDDKFIVEMDLYGKLTHQDYKVIIPVVERAISAAGEREFDILVDMRDFEGWELEAVFDDFKLGMEIKDVFNKMAVVGDKKWEEWSVKVMSHLTKGEMRFFEDYDKAFRWIVESK